MCVINNPNLQKWSGTKENFPKSSNSGGPGVGRGQPLAEMFNDFTNRTLLSCQRVRDAIHFQNEVKLCMRSLVQSLLNPGVFLKFYISFTSLEVLAQY